MVSTAFALAGLGGFNAHGAGFLDTVAECNVVPDLVTATSGQIVLLSEWLQGKKLKDLIINAKLEHTPVGQATVGLTGYPGVFRPAYMEAFTRWLIPPAEKDARQALLNRILPAQLYVPTRGPEVFQTIADVFNGKIPNVRFPGHRTGVVFNAYNLATGHGVLYGNERARDFWPTQKAIPNATRLAGARYAPTPEDRELQPITAKAVESALWLSLYGFDNLPERDLMDGAYHRSCIVAELTHFDRVFVARPLAEGWLGPRPANQFDVQDWQTEMWFSASYKAEVDALNQINGLVKDGHLGEPFKYVDLVEVAPETPAGFFNYFIEREDVYDKACQKTLEKLRERGLVPEAKLRAEAAP